MFAINDFPIIITKVSIAKSLGVAIWRIIIIKVSCGIGAIKIMSEAPYSPSDLAPNNYIEL